LSAAKHTAPHGHSLAPVHVAPFAHCVSSQHAGAAGNDLQTCFTHTEPASPVQSDASLQQPARSPLQTNALVVGSHAQSHPPIASGVPSGGHTEQIMPWQLAAHASVGSQDALAPVQKSQDAPGAPKHVPGGQVDGSMVPSGQTQTRFWQTACAGK
jgi:hypothetical protein